MIVLIIEVSIKFESTIVFQIEYTHNSLFFVKVKILLKSYIVDCVLKCLNPLSVFPQLFFSSIFLKSSSSLSILMSCISAYLAFIPNVTNLKFSKFCFFVNKIIYIDKKNGIC